MGEVRVAQLGAVPERVAAAGRPVGVDTLAGERGEAFDGVVAEVLTPEDRGEAVLAQLVTAGDVAVVVPRGDDVVEAVVGLEDLANAPGSSRTRSTSA